MENAIITLTPPVVGQKVVTSASSITFTIAKDGLPSILVKCAPLVDHDGNVKTQANLVSNMVNQLNEQATTLNIVAKEVGSSNEMIMLIVPMANDYVDAKITVNSEGDFAGFSDRDYHGGIVNLPDEKATAEALGKGAMAAAALVGAFIGRATS